MSRSWAAGLLASLVLALSIGSAPDRAAAFGTVEGGGQHREHERINRAPPPPPPRPRAALACPAGTGSGGDCFEPRSIDQLAGHGNGFGDVGSPDRTEAGDPSAHCDDADFLA